MQVYNHCYVILLVCFFQEVSQTCFKILYVEIIIDCTEEWVILGLACLLTLMILVGTESKQPPSLSIFWLFQVWSFIMSIMWIYMLSNILVDVLVMYECITGISAALLGLTVLSWGNSVGDAVASFSISKKGLGEMAFTGCIAGPLFNLLLGLGITTMRCNMILP